ncbi:Sip1-related alpha-galactosidase [Neolewinella antarctica]|uniref:Alpha-galactosidase n=1 Tax=Neolewinella antarctica TaxID=442734 RepID=A0ABX0X9P8_9BACT|nr:Sip1-related alpha-galactosidase [Neolewinella antarctica]NJC25649.1 hypothetical protein [Neolewinella antarctica]
MQLILAIVVVGSLSCRPPASPLGLQRGDDGITVIYRGQERLTALKGYSAENAAGTEASAEALVENDYVLISLKQPTVNQTDADNFKGSFFDGMPGFDQGVALWRYKPWNSWTKPMLVTDPSDIEDWDVQFFYWKYDDGLFGAAMPLSGRGYRTTLGSHQGKFGAKSVSYGPALATDKIPQLVIGFGDDPHALFAGLYRAGLNSMGATDNLVTNKSFPDQLDYLGWCTWNASNLGKALNEDLIIESVKTFTENDFPLGYVIVDDGWLDATAGMLNSFRPDTTKFPNGFSSLNDTLKTHFGIKNVGMWHTFNGYWNGINPDSELGERYRAELFSWQQKVRPTDPDSSALVTHHFIRPESDSLLSFYQSMHEQLSDQGVDFLKVDNQLVTEKMAVNNYPIFTLSEKMHAALYQSADTYFDGAVINCMDMTAEAYLNFGSSAVARAVEDYFPEHEGGVGYGMERGNAAAHLVMAFYNSIYFQQMVFPDFDMFESHNPDAEFHAIARAINNGPIYVTDEPGSQDFAILRALCYSDGKLIRPSRPLTPTKDCLFQLQEPKVFKAFSGDEKVGLVGAWNLADSDLVKGTLSPSDVVGLEGDDFVVHEYFSNESWRLSKQEKLQLELPRMGYQLFFILPVVQRAAVIGLLNKYNSPGTIVTQNVKKGRMEVVVADYGTFAAIIPERPTSVACGGKEVAFAYVNELLTVEILAEVRRNFTVVVEW